jgi:hypothetical protein
LKGANLGADHPESPEGGWGIDRHANTNAEIAAAARAALDAD